MGYVYLAASLGSPGLIKIGYTKGDPKKRVAQLQTGNPQGVRLVHAIAVSDPKSVERVLHRHFATKRKRGEWFQVSVSEARKAIYAIAHRSAQIDAQRELDEFVMRISGFAFQIVMYFVVMILLILGISAGSLFGSILGSEFFQTIGVIGGIFGAILLVGVISKRVRRIFYGAQISEKAREIERKYEELYSVDVAFD